MKCIADWNNISLMQQSKLIDYVHSFLFLLNTGGGGARVLGVLVGPYPSCHRCLMD